MLFVIVGAVLMALKFAEIAPVANWDWWWVLAPFGLAVLWWAFADKSGLTKRREIEKMEDRKRERREKSMQALGLNPRERERLSAAERVRRAQASKVERVRAEKRRVNRDTIARSSRLDDQKSEPSIDSKR